MVPNGWEKHPVGKICSSIVPGRNKPKQFGGDIAWVTTPEITGKFIPSSVQKNYISEETIKECGGKVVPKGAVVMAAVGDLGLIAITKEEVVLNQQLHAFVCSSKINNEFLAYWLATQTPYMESVASKTTILYLNKTNCESIPVLVPPLPEQQKIAKILSTWDKAISTTECLIENSIQQKKALMQQLLTGKKHLLDDEGKRFEGEWDEVTIDSTFKLITDYVASGSFASLKENVNVSDDEGYAHYVRQTDLAAKFKNKTLKWVNEDSYSYLKKSNLYEGDILFTNIGDLGKVFYMPKLEKPATVAPNLIVLRVNQKNNSKYIFYMLSSYVGQRQINRIKSGTGLPKINKTEFKTMRFKIPRLEEQQKVATVLTNADKEIELLEQQLSDLQQEKKALMQVLLTGKKRVVVDGEVA